MRTIFLFFLLSVSTAFSQVELRVGPIANTNNWTVINPEVKGKYAIQRPWSEVGTRWGIETTLWVKEHFGFRLGFMRCELTGGYEFDAPIVGINGGGYALVFGQMYPMHILLRYPALKIWKRNIYLKFGIGTIFAHHRGFDYANYTDQTYIAYSNYNIRIDYDEKGNGQFRKNFALLDGNFGVDVDILKWLSLGFEGGYSKGFTKLGEYEVFYKITNESLQYARTSIDGSRFYYGFRMGLRLFKTKPQNKKTATID